MPTIITEIDDGVEVWVKTEIHRMFSEKIEEIFKGVKARVVSEDTIFGRKITLRLEREK